MSERSMIIEPNLGEGHAAEIFGDYEYGAPLPDSKKFLPWHRPRKQFVRDYQWFEQIKKLYIDSGSNQKQLTYLGLPGVDLLDLRYFHSAICLEHEIKLKFLGFNSAASPSNDSQTEMAISLDEVTKLEHIDPRSEVIWDDFCQIGNTNSNAWKKACAAGPFNVINLDLCDGFGLQPPNCMEDNHYNALNQLLTLQSRSAQPWLLFLTTRAGTNHVHSDVLERLKSHYSKSLHECLSFKEVSNDSFSIQDNISLEEALKTGEGLMSVFITGICNWLLNIATSQRPPTKVEVKSVIGYKVNSKSEGSDLISVALKFIPVFDANTDVLGLATNARSSLDICDLSTKAIRRVAAIKDADAILEADEAIAKKMTDDMGRLLQEARYDMNAYLDWLKQDNVD
ncbi:PP_RS20740 family protein [Pseudomonas savastanoi]|uniref:PP_RS20740 family protein n=1 Tax=Pseudomonas savastanoi TaxID=29438 RepID=UPI00070CA020|nr:hypothetical protein [Pseudomonas savastanoi]KWS44731.1 hypothetical protein AL058_01450 [Pseudomonas savastanoi pv. nerii]